MPPIAFATQSYQSPSLPVSAQRCVNLFLEIQPKDAKAPRPLFGVPGILPWGNCGAGPIRGLHVMDGTLYAVSGAALYVLNANGGATQIGAGIGGNANVSMSDNGTQLCVVNAANGFIYNASSKVFTQIDSPNFYPAQTVTFFDDVFVFDRMGTNQFFISATLDGTTYPDNNFASAEVKPAPLVGVLNDHETLLIFTQKIIESWYDAGASVFPFQRYDGGTIERGCAASLSLVQEDNAVFFLGDDLVFYRLNYPIPIRVSTHAVEAAWQKYGYVGDAFAFSYTFRGHKFITLVFPSGPGTWVYDVATGMWHERESWDQNNNSYNRWRASAFANCYNRLLIGDAYTGNIGYLDVGTFTEYGNTLRGLAVSPPIHSDRKRVFMPRFELDIQTGDGLPAGGTPELMLDWSDDGGRSFSQQQPWRSMGKTGEYTIRLRWLKLGQSRQRVMRVQITDPVPRVIISAHADLSVGM